MNDTLKNKPWSNAVRKYLCKSSDKQHDIVLSAEIERVAISLSSELREEEAQTKVKNQSYNLNSVCWLLTKL